MKKYFQIKLDITEKNWRLKATKSYGKSFPHWKYTGKQMSSHQRLNNFFSCENAAYNGAWIKWKHISTEMNSGNQINTGATAHVFECKQHRSANICEWACVSVK